MEVNICTTALYMEWSNVFSRQTTPPNMDLRRDTEEDSKEEKRTQTRRERLPRKSGHDASYTGSDVSNQE